MIDYEGIINNLETNKVIELMKSLGATQFREDDKAVIFPTICHNISEDEASMKLYYYKDTHIFYCYTEDGAQTIFKFLEHYYQCRGIEYNWYDDIFEVVQNCTYTRTADFVIPRVQLIGDRYKQKRADVVLPEVPQSVLNNFIKFYPIEWLNDGISKEAMDKFNIRYSISQNKIVIPHYDVNGRLVGIRGRALNEWEVENVGKYAPICLEGTWYKHPLSMNLYGLYENRQAIRRTGYVFLCESEKAVLQAESFSRPNCCVAVCGSSVNKYQINLLMRECSPREFILCLDKEQHRYDDVYFDKLYKICQKYGNYGNWSFVYDQDGLLNLKDSPTDRGEEVFEKLLKRRVRVDK